MSCEWLFCYFIISWVFKWAPFCCWLCQSFGLDSWTGLEVLNSWSLRNDQYLKTNLAWIDWQAPPPPPPNLIVPGLDAFNLFLPVSGTEFNYGLALICGVWGWLLRVYTTCSLSFHWVKKPTLIKTFCTSKKFRFTNASAGISLIF